MSNLVATWASGDTFCRSNGFFNYLQSLSNVEAEKVVFTHDMPDDTRVLLGKMNISIVEVNPTKIHFLIRDRYLAYWNFLVESGHKYKYCAFTDSKDVIFQRNLFEYVLFGPTVALMSEGMTHSQSGWNSIDQFECQRNVREFSVDLGSRPILNGGVIIGSSNELRDLFLLLWSNTVRCVGNCTDQAVLNYLYSFLEREGKLKYVVCDPQRDWMCITGEAVKQGHFKPIIEEGVFLHPETKQQYYVVHQYERIEGIAEIVYKKYGEQLAHKEN